MLILFWPPSGTGPVIIIGDGIPMDLPERVVRFDMPSRSTRFDIPGAVRRVVQFDMPARSTRFDMPGADERFDLPERR